MPCPAIAIPELGVEAPGADTPAAIEKSAGQAQWVLSVKMPAVAGVTPAAIWQHKYRDWVRAPVYYRLASPILDRFTAIGRNEILEGPMPWMRAVRPRP